jgi:hypothetical protein
VEVPLLVLLLRKRCGASRAALTGVAASGVTHPLLWYGWTQVIPPYTYRLWLRYVVTGELLVVAVEAAIVALVALRVVPGWTWSRRVLVALGVSALVNAASLGAGMLTWLF